MRQTRAFSYIDDVAPVIAGCVDVPKSACQVFNIGADRPYEVLELAHVVSHALGVDPVITFLPPRNEVQHAYASHEKAHRIFGGNSSVNLERGIGEMAQWARRVGARQSATFKNIELRKNLPPSWNIAPVEQLELTQA